MTLVLMAGLGAMNMSVFLPALPHMATHFETNYGTMQLSVSLYFAATAILQVIIGPISDNYGRRPVMLGCAVVFVLATVGCLLSTSVEMFLVFRMMQGCVAAGLALSRAIVRDMVPAEQAASMIAYVTMGMSLVPMVAPMIGGGLDQIFGWQAIFIFLILCGIALLVLIAYDLGETRSGEGVGFKAQFKGYPELLTSTRFWGYVMSSACASGAFFVFLGGAPLVATKIYGLNSFWSGVGFGAPAIGYMVGNFIAGRYSVDLGINTMILRGSLLTTGLLAAAVILTMLNLGGPLVFFGASALVGLGNGMVIPNASAGTVSVRPALAGTASGLGSAIMVGLGAAMSALAGPALQIAPGAQTLQVLMLISSALSLPGIALVIRRETRLAKAGAVK